MYLVFSVILKEWLKFRLILYFSNEHFFPPLDIERYSKRYMKVYKEEWIPGNYKAENVRMIFKGFLPRIF